MTCASSGGALCNDCGDSNDDGIINIADPVKILAVLFGGGGALPEPFTECGEDPSPDTLGCISFDPCD